MPATSLVFATTLFQYSRVSDIPASFIISAYFILAAAISPLGGWVSDAAFGWSPPHGRPLVAQVCAAVKVVIAYVLFVVLTGEWGWGGGAYVGQAGCFLMLGCLSGWPHVTTLRPILTDVVPQKCHATVFAVVSKTTWVWHPCLSALSCRYTRAVPLWRDC